MNTEDFCVPPYVFENLSFINWFGLASYNEGETKIEFGCSMYKKMLCPFPSSSEQLNSPFL